MTEDSKEEKKRGLYDQDLIQLLLKDQQKKCFQEFSQRMLQKLPFGERENRLKEILFEYFPSKSKDDWQYLTFMIFLTDPRGYGRGKEKFLFYLKEMMNSVLNLEPSLPMIQAIENAFQLPSQASNARYFEALSSIFSEKERKLIEIFLPDTDHFCISKINRYLYFTTIHNKIDLQLSVSLLEAEDLKITEEQYLQAEQLISPE